MANLGMVSEKMATTTAIPDFHRLRLQFGLGILLVLAGVIVGNGLAFQHSRSAVLHDIEQRGIWGARNLAHDAWQALNMQALQELRPRVDAFLLQDDVVYVGIAAQDGTLRISSGSPLRPQASALPELPNHSCRTNEPLLDSEMVFGEQVLLVSVPIVPVGAVLDHDAALADTCRGTLHIGMSLAALDQRLFHMLVTLILVCGYVIGIGALAYRLAHRQIIVPLTHAAAIVQGMARGDFRRSHAETCLSDSAGSSRNSDVDLIPRTLADFTDLARTQLGGLKDRGGHLTMTIGEGVTIAEEALMSVQQHTLTASQVSAALETHSESLDALAADAEQIASTAANSVEAARTIVEMIAQALSAMQELSGQTSRNNERIGQLGGTFAQIGSVVGMLNTIADQTRMIAFNAGIEAAGAGESGGRFSIVAAEVRRLADTVVESSDEIQELVSSIQAATSELTLSSETEIRKANWGVTLIGTIETTTHAMLEQLESTARIAQRITAAARQQREIHHTAAQEIAELEELSQNTTAIARQSLAVTRQMQQLATQIESALQTIRV